jgi:hypothetical protein
MTSNAQVRANQQNAQKSTGPKSLDGKQKVGGNRITHGILSTKLLLVGEDGQDYQALLGDLQVQLRPVGVLELSLVEKIAVTLWRQRRLVGAETASIELELTSRRVANEVTVAMGLSGYGGEKIEPSDLQPLAQNQLDQLRWCKSLVEQHGQASAVTLDNLREAAPLIYAQLTKDAKGDSEAISEYLAQSSLEDYIRELVYWCRNEVRNLETMEARQSVVSVLSKHAADKLVVPWQRLDVLNKYQTTLDNQLYKAIKALRVEQSWRLDNADAIDTTTPLVIGFE